MSNNSNAQQTEQNQIHTDFHLKIKPATTYMYIYCLYCTVVVFTVYTYTQWYCSLNNARILISYHLMFVT